MATMPNVIKRTVTSEIVIIHIGTRSRRLLRKTSNSPSSSNGTKLSQNLLHNRVRSEIGEVCRIQKAWPSRLTDGKAKRIATAMSRKPARARLAKQNKVFKLADGRAKHSSG